MKKAMSLLLATTLAMGLCACGTQTESTGNKEAAKGEAAAEVTFTPRLDTEQTATLEISGFMGNFEALDQVINAFNEIYPNVTFYYDHNSAFMLPQYLESNNGNDIFMADDQNIKGADLTDYYVQDWCVDLAGEDINTSAVWPEALSDCTVDGKLLRLPVAMNPCGIVVNTTLLKKEGLSVPQNYEEFLSVMAALKEKGYVPLQGSEQHLYGELMVNMAMNVLAENAGAVEALQAGEDSAVETILPVFEKLETILQNGYTDYDLNCTYPADNYDGSIMAFYEGNMPFYVCNAECVSGMKKRESKSETFTANPFTYEFLYAPLGENGVYAYTEPWYGFCVNKNSDAKDLAVEFLRFMMTTEQLDNMGSIKGMPAAATNGTDERYAGIQKISNLEASFSNDGSVPGEIRAAFVQVCNDFGAGVYADAREAVGAFAEQCKK